MSTEQKSNFIHDDFLLDSRQAKVLFHDFAKDMPILDYHNHLSARQIAEDKPLKNIASAWLGGMTLPVKGEAPRRSLTLRSWMSAGPKCALFVAVKSRWSSKSR